MARELTKRGFSKVFVVSGGCDAWIQAKLRTKAWQGEAAAFNTLRAPSALDEIINVGHVAGRGQSQLDTLPVGPASRHCTPACMLQGTDTCNSDPPCCRWLRSWSRWRRSWRCPRRSRSTPELRAPAARAACHWRQQAAVQVHTQAATSGPAAEAAGDTAPEQRQ